MSLDEVKLGRNEVWAKRGSEAMLGVGEVMSRGEVRTGRSDY